MSRYGNMEDSCHITAFITWVAGIYVLGLPWSESPTCFITGFMATGITVFLWMALIIQTNFTYYMLSSNPLPWLPPQPARHQLNYIKFNVAEHPLSQVCSRPESILCYHGSRSILIWNTLGEFYLWHFPSRPIFLLSWCYRWIPLTKASDAELWCFLWSVPEQTVE